MRTFSREDLELARRKLGFSEEEFSKTIGELTQHGLLSTNVISKFENYTLTPYAIKLAQEEDN